MTPDELRARIAQLEGWNNTQAEAITRLRRELCGQERQAERNGERAEKLQQILNNRNAEIERLKDKRAQAERFFKDGQE